MPAWWELDTLRPFGLVRTIPLYNIKHNRPLFSELQISMHFIFLSGMKLILSALVDGKSINAGGHKVGLGLELEA